MSAGRPIVVYDPTWPPARRHAAQKALPPDLSDVAARAGLFYVGYTSGSSGPPKPFARSEASWARSFEVDRAVFGLAATDVVAAASPIRHSLGLYGVLSSLAAGAEALLANPSPSPRAFLELMRRRRATILTATPAQILLLARAASAAPVPSLRLILSGGAALQPAQEEEIAAAFPSAAIAPYYGASELSYVAMRRPGEAAPAGSVGRPAPGVSVAILDADGAPRPAGSTGRITVESPFAAAGYLGPDGLTPLPLLGAGVFLGDLGRLDADGFLFIDGRADRMIVVSGRNVAPERVEAALEAHPAVAAAAVFGLPDGVRGARLVAVLSVEGEAPAAADLAEHCRARLGAAETPSRYLLARDWPRLASGKTDFAGLEARLAVGALERLA